MSSENISTESTRPDRRAAFISLLALIILATLGAVSFSRPRALGTEAPATEFSAARAVEHLEKIASGPRPIGSASHVATREYLLGELRSLGLETEVQTAVALSQRGRRPRTASVQNILGRLRGSAGGGKAVAKVAHYDTTLNSPGAGDNGSSVVAILETLRAIRSGDPLSNDLIVLFTDAEEVGLLGAEAFVDEHPWAGEIKVLLNFEARGNRGPVVMFESSVDSRHLIEGFAEAAPYPVTTSLANEIYRLLPNATDFLVFKGAGLKGLGFAYINGLSAYHSATDTVDRLDVRSVQHQGSYMLALTRHFDNAEPAPASGGEAIFFTIFRKTFVYAASWALPLALMAAIGWVALLVLSLRRRHLRGRAVGRSFLITSLCLVLAPAASFVVSWLLLRFDPVFLSMRRGGAYDSGLHFAAVTLIALAVTVLIFRRLGRRVQATEAAAGALSWLVIAALASAIFLPGASYLFLWPLFGGLISLAGFLLTRGDGKTSTLGLGALVVGASPAVLLAAPLVPLLLVALTLRPAPAVMLILVLLLFGVSQQLTLAGGRWGGWLSGLLAAAGLACMAAGLTLPNFGPDRPQPTSLFYLVDSDTGDGRWASSNRPDRWTSEALGESYAKESLVTLLPRYRRPFFVADAPALDLAGASIELLEDGAEEDGSRRLRLLLSAPQGVANLDIDLTSDAPILSAAIGGKALPHDGEGSGFGWTHYGVPPEGIELVIRLARPDSLNLTVAGQSFGLPGNAPERPENMIPDTTPWSDSHFVRRAFHFPVTATDPAAEQPGDVDQVSGHS